MVLDGGELRTQVSYNTNGFPIPPHVLVFLEKCFAHPAQVAGDETAGVFRAFKKAQKQFDEREEETAH